MQPGSRLGHYQILSALGKGGMGEVWKAHDTTLRREVAIKTLPEEFANHPDRLARFEREATLLASLNHPNIAAIHGLEQDQGTRFLVLELVDGTTLTPTAGRDPGAVADALRVALQIAEALEFAHGKGVIHRDLKPANIKVTPEGRVKVLDFGLAKALAPVSEETPTITAMPTEAGVIMGTPAYMSPEQARGDITDTQSDIWSFGVVLYELLTGASPFGRRSTADTLASVLGPPPDYAVLPSTIPASARLLVRRCLEKDRKRRFQHMGDVRIALEEAIAALATDAVPGSHGGASAPRRRGLAAAGVIALAGLFGAGGWWLASRAPGATPGGVVRLSIPSMEAPRVLPSGTRHLAVSADGTQIAYASAGRLLVRQMGRKDPIVIDAVASNPFFSPSGEWVGFFGDGAEAGLRKVRATGGAPVLISATPERTGGGTWRADGTIVFATTEGLFQVAENGGPALPLVKPDAARKERAYLWPQFLPGGRAVMFTVVPDGAIDGAQIAVLNLDTLAVTEVLKGGTAADYAPTGHLIYGSGQTLKAVLFDLASLRTRGDPVALPDIEIASTPDNGAADFAVSDTGTLIFLSPGSQTLRTLMWIDRRGKAEPLPLPPAEYTNPRVSPDGRRLAVDIQGANRDIWISNLERPSLTRLTSGPTEDLLPAWSRDGQRIYFASNRTGNFDVYSQAADGASEARVEFAGPGTQMLSSLTPDGTRLLLVQDFKDAKVLNLARPGQLEPLLQSEFNEWIPVVSPDGNWVAYESNESGSQIEIFLRPFPNVSARREKISIDGGRYPLWGPAASGLLYYVDPNGNMMSASVRTSPSLQLGPVTKLFQTDRPSRGISGRPYDLSPLDGRFLATRIAGGGSNASVNISVALNWFQELLERLPTRPR